MTAIPTFGSWDQAIHESADQQKRLDRACKADVTPASIDTAAKTGLFPGSGAKPYIATLDSCTCSDFIRRKLPCKHIYRLALECGEIKLHFAVGENKNLQRPLEDFVAELENLSDDIQQMLFSALRYLRDSTACDMDFVVSQSVNTNIGCSLISFTPASFELVLADKKKSELVELLTRCNIEYDMRLKKRALMDLCVANRDSLQPILPYSVRMTLSPEVNTKVRRSLYTYLRRKYEWDIYFNGNMQSLAYPCGASEDYRITIKLNPDDSCVIETSGDDDLCYFPDDKITKLLTLYGHNRCLNGFKPIPECEIPVRIPAFQVKPLF